MPQITKKSHKGIEYWVKGDNPTLLIHSGTHGDEYGVIEHVKEYLCSNDTPDFIYVPEVSPSAVKRKTRKNLRNIDLNRSFKDNADDPEVLANMEIAKKYKVEKLLTFHEDWEFDSYYVYHCEKNSKQAWNKAISNMSNTLKEKGYQGFTGIDDTDLGNEVVNGYLYIPASTVDGSCGTFENWGIFNRLFSAYVNPEVPMYYSSTQKKELVFTIMEHLLKV